MNNKLEWLESIRGGDKHRLCAVLTAMLIYCLTYAIFYNDSFFVEPEIGFRWIYGFISMMLGSMIYSYRDRVLDGRRNKWTILAMASCGGFLAAKLCMTRISILLRVQFMTQLFGVGFAVFSLIAGIAYEKEITQMMKSHLGRLVAKVSECSLEIYLVQFPIIAMLKALVFPINFLAICSFIFGAASIIHNISREITMRMIKEKGRW